MSRRRLLPDPPTDRLPRGPHPRCTCGTCQRCLANARDRRWRHRFDPTDEQLDAIALRDPAVRRYR